MLNSEQLTSLLARLPSREALEAEILRRSTSAAVTHDRDSVRERCKTLAGFIREAWHVLLPTTPYIPNWHINLICRHLEAVSRGELLTMGRENRLLINVVPGASKTLIVTVFWPAWEWGAFGRPDTQIIATSFRDDACRTASVRFRSLVTSDWYQSLWPVEITTRSEWLVENTSKGRREAIPFGSLMGSRADRLLIDDPHSIDDPESDADRQRAEMRFRESATTRVNDPIRSAIVVIMQRLHQKDISGIIIDGKMPYTIVMLPMRFEPDRKCVTPFGEDPRTKEGELLFPSRFPRSAVDRDEATMGAHATAGQHQQRPTPRGGLKFKRHNFPLVKVVPSGCRTVRGWDLAASENRNSAYTCGLKLSFHSPTRHFYIEHVVRVRTENVEPVIVNTARQDNANGHRVEISLPQDPGQAGKVQVKALVGALIGFIVHRSPESGDKLSRAEPVIAQSEAGNISILEGDWNEAFLDEVELFPSGTFKDQVDALSRAFSRFVMTPTEFVLPPIVVTAQRTSFGDHPGE